MITSTQTRVKSRNVHQPEGPTRLWRTYLGLLEHHLIGGELGHAAGPVDAGDPAGAQRAEGGERGAPGCYKHGCGTGHAFPPPSSACGEAAGAESCAGLTVGRINLPARQQLCSHVMRALLISSVQTLHKQREQGGGRGAPLHHGCSTRGEEEGLEILGTKYSHWNRRKPGELSQKNEKVEKSSCHQLVADIYLLLSPRQRPLKAEVTQN